MNIKALRDNLKTKINEISIPKRETGTQENSVAGGDENCSKENPPATTKIELMFTFKDLDGKTMQMMKCLDSVSVNDKNTICFDGLNGRNQRDDNKVAAKSKSELCMYWPKCKYADKCFYTHPRIKCKYVPMLKS